MDKDPFISVNKFPFGNNVVAVTHLVLSRDQQAIIINQRNCCESIRSIRFYACFRNKHLNHLPLGPPGTFPLQHFGIPSVALKGDPLGLLGKRSW